MGATAMVGAFITGQLLGSVIIDHFGLFGLQSYTLNYSRLMGIFLLFAGLLLVVRKSA
jgi:transporter family-2 protein